MLLRFSLVPCSPFAKFFLLKFVTRYGNQMPWVDQVTEIINAVELPKSRFYGVVKELRSLGILEVQATKPTEVNKVRYQVKIKEPDICSFALKRQPHLHQHKVNGLLTRNSHSTSKLPHQLTIPQRILMIALLEEADAGGIIRNVGFSDLAQRTGLTIRQVKNQMSKLREFHYVRVSLRGGNTTGLTGRYNSVHALNLRHPNFDQQSASGGIVIFGQSVPSIPDEYLNYFHFQHRELRKGLSKQRRTSHVQIDQRDELLKLASRAGNLQAASTWIFLNWLCHDLASRTLSELWKELSELTVAELSTIIGDKIRGEWLSAYRAIIEVDDDKKPGQKKAVRSKQPELAILPLIEMSMSTAVRDIARGIKKALMDSEALPDHAQNYHFQILPIPHKGEKGHFALEITEGSETRSSQKNEFVLALGFDPKQGKITVNSISDVYALKHNALEMTGLASPPLSCPMLARLPKTKK
jgi:DNA-binding transcriptional ArsR family regulator